MTHNEPLLIDYQLNPVFYLTKIYALRYEGKRMIFRALDDVEYQYNWYKQLEHIRWIPKAHYIGPAIIGGCKEEKNGILMDYVPGTTFDCVYWPAISKDVRNRIIKNLRRAVDLIHNAGFVHGDLHGGNIILTPRMSFRIIDPANCGDGDSDQLCLDDIISNIKTLPFPIAKRKNYET